MQTERQTNRHIERQREWNRKCFSVEVTQRTDKQTNRQTDRHRYRQIGTQKDRWIDLTIAEDRNDGQKEKKRHRDKQKNCKTDRQTDRQIDTE
jgi:hypothetical protein